MKVPGNVLRFEELLYISLILDALAVAAQDRTPTPEITDDAIMSQTILNGVVIVLLAYFVHLAAQRRKSWPRWIMLGALVLSVMSLALALSSSGMTLDVGIEIIS